MRQLACLIFFCITLLSGFSQSKRDSLLTEFNFKKDSSLRAMFHDDSLKIEKEFAEKAKWDKIKDIAVFPVLNSGLIEVVRKINLHVASGIPLKKIFPVVLIHAGALNAITTNKYYKEHYKLDNPNLKVINDLVNLGAKFIACGQAMAFFNIKADDLLPLVKISLTAQTVLSSYQLKGYVLYHD
jgi:intracellular sulfur oxidation DsrE/DsrF family protein